MKTRTVLAITLSMAVPRHAAADERAECAKSYEQTQRLRQDGSMVRALEDAERCARESCPELLRSECTTWSKELRASAARVSIHVRGADGCAAEHATVAPSPHVRLDGDVWLVDPGAQELSVTDPASKQTKKVQLDLRPGERRDIDVDFAAPNATCAKGDATTPAPSAAHRLPPVAVGLASVGVGFIVLGGTLGVIGAGKRDDLDECKPTCSAERIDAVKPYFVIGDTVAAVGLVSIGAAIAVYFAVTRRPAQASAGSSSCSLSVSF